MQDYIHDNTDDEITHHTFFNAYLVSKGAAPANLDPFRTLMGSTATGVNPDWIGHLLTNLTQLTIDTSWWTRYRDDSHFFFSSRRRHTRLVSDWSSDVCSSDLTIIGDWLTANAYLPVPYALDEESSAEGNA